MNNVRVGVVSEIDTALVSSRSRTINNLSPPVETICLFAENDLKDKLNNKRLMELKGNGQFIFLCNPQKSAAQKLLTKYIFNWLELITEILSFLQIFSVKTTQLF